MRILLLSILAHIVGDFVLQSDKIVNQKNKLDILGYLKHGVIVFLTLIVFLHTYRLTDVIKYSLCISIVHVILDYLKSKFFVVKNRLIDLSAFLVDQVIHLFVIYMIWESISLNVNKALEDFYRKHVFSKMIAELGSNHLKITFNVLIIYLIVYLFVIYFGAIFIRKYLDIHFPNGAIFTKKQSKINFPNGALITSISNDQKNVGKHIGMLERIIILTLVITNNYSSIAFVFAAKSIARFKEIENNKDFAEYYLIGTLLSCVIAILGGSILKFLITIV